jgi:hypothetical protein
MPDSVQLKEAITLKAQANLGEEIEDVEFAEGDELVVLKEWKDHYLVKDPDGKLFNVRKELVRAV